MHKPSGSQRLPVEPPFRGPLHACSMVCLLAVLSAAVACTSTSETETFLGPAQTRCAVTARANTTSFPSSGGSGTVEISTARECSWVVQSDAPWVALQADARGQGDGSVRFTIAANANPASRAAALSVSDTRVQISQEGQPCEFRLSSTHQTIDAGGGQLVISVDASNASCTWSTSDDVPWITITGGASRTGSGTVVIQIAPASAALRSGTITVAGQTVTIDQGAACTVTPGVTTASVGDAGGRVEIPVLAGSDCPWTAQSEASWITITGGASGTGPGTVVLAVPATDGPLRAGTINVAGVQVTVAQQSGCRYFVQPFTYGAAPGGASGSITVQTGAGCPWTADSAAPWITVPHLSGTGTTAVPFVVAPNNSPERVGTLTVAGTVITVVQQSPCTWRLSPTSADLGADGGRAAVQVIVDGCTWSAVSTVDWVTIEAGQTGTGAGVVQFAVSPNPGGARVGILRIGGLDLAVRQAGR